MQDRKFTTKIEQCHRKWLGETIAISQTGHNGIDFLNDFFGIELKSKLLKKGYPKNFAVNADQVHNFPKAYGEKDYYWAFMFYTFSKSVSEVRERDKLEPLVTKREVWCLPWDWIQQFPIFSPKYSGPFHYVPKHKFNGINFTAFSTNKGNIHVQSDTSLEQRLINRVLMYSEEQNPKLY
ncbi:MAG: hypothetical protein Q8R18_01310 [bacterium]|nr:hypothetical protein [bacterium]